MFMWIENYVNPNANCTDIFLNNTKILFYLIYSEKKLIVCKEKVKLHFILKKYLALFNSISILSLTLQKIFLELSSGGFQYQTRKREEIYWR